MTQSHPQPQHDRLLSDALSALEIKLARLEQRSHEREASLEARDEEIRGLKQIIKTLQGQHLSALEEIQRRGETLRAVRSGFENSTSWKVTRPLRWVMQRLRGSAHTAPDADVDSGISPAIWTSPPEPEPAPANELQWLQRLDCTRDDYGVWLQTFESHPTVENDALERPTTDTTLMSSDADGVIVSFISVLDPLNPPDLDVRSLDGPLSALKAQTITNWEWLIVADTSQRTVLSDWLATELRVRFLHKDGNEPAEGSSLTDLKEARGRYVVWLDLTFTLRPHALSYALAALRHRPDTHVFYSDEDVLAGGSRHSPQFHGDYNPDLWLSGDPLGRFVLFQTEAVRQAGGFQHGAVLDIRYDLLLRMLERMDDPSRQVLHLPYFLCHHLSQPAASVGPNVLLSLCSAGTAAPQKTAWGVIPVKRHLERTGVAATASPHPSLPGHCRVRFALPTTAPSVGIVIPTRDSVGVLSVCLSTLLERSSYPDFKVVVVDNGSCKPETLHFLASITDPRVKVIRDDAPFNFSRVVNLGAAAVEGEILCLLNNDMQITQPDWLEEMVGWAIQPGVAAVGARLWYGEGQLQHGGIILGIQGMAGHAHKFLKKGDPGYMNRAELHQTMSAVTGACMVVRRSVYEELGGFDEALGVAYNDVDFCLRARKAGYRNVWTPFAEMIHHESISRGFEDSPEKKARFQQEAALMRERWADWLADDPAYNPNLTLEHEDFGLAWPPRKRQS